MELVAMAIGISLDCNHLFAMNGLTEVHLVINAVLKLNGEMKLTADQKAHFVEFLICFNGNRDPNVIEGISTFIDNLGMTAADSDGLLKLLHE